MTALTSDRSTQRQEASRLALPVAASTKIYAGSIVCVNAAGYAVPGSTATTLRYIGMAEEYVDNSAGSNGDVTVQVRRKQAFKWANSGTDPVAQADVGDTVYIVDDQTVAKTNGTSTRSAAGKLLAVDTDGVWIE